MFPLDCAISLLLPAWRKKFGSRAGGCAVFQRFAQEAAHEKAGWMGRCIGAGLAVPAGRGFPLLPAGGANERTGHGGGMPRGGGGARPALCRRIRADAAAAGGVVAGAPPAADGRSPRGKNRGLRAGVRRLAGGERVRRGARVGLCARRKGRGRSVSGPPWKRHRGGAASPFGEVRALEACGAPDGFGGAAGASLLYSLRTEGGLFEVRFTMDGLYTAQVRADAAEQALQILAALAAQSPESRGQNLSAAEKLCIMGRGLNRG